MNSLSHHCKALPLPLPPRFVSLTPARSSNFGQHSHSSISIFFQDIPRILLLSATPSDLLASARKLLDLLPRLYAGRLCPAWDRKCLLTLQKKLSIKNTLDHGGQYAEDQCIKHKRQHFLHETFATPL